MNRQSYPIELIESVHTIIKKRTGRIRLQDIIEIIGSKEKAHYAIIWLTRKQRIKRIKGFGSEGIEYFYHDLESHKYLQKNNIIVQ